MASKGFFVSNCPNGRLQSGAPVDTMKTTARLGGALEDHDAVGSECYDATTMLDRSLARLRDRTVLRLGLEQRRRALAFADVPHAASSVAAVGVAARGSEGRGGVGETRG